MIRGRDGTPFYKLDQVCVFPMGMVLSLSGLEMGMDFSGEFRKSVLENSTFWSKMGSGFGEPSGQTPPKIPRSTSWVL